MRPLLLIFGVAVIGLASYSADARGMGGNGGGGAHFAGARGGVHHFGFNRSFGRFGFNRFNGGWGWAWGYGDYGWGYGGYDYPNYATPSTVIVMPQQTPSAAPVRRRVGDLPPCHEVTPSGVAIDRGMGCSRGAG